MVLRPCMVGDLHYAQVPPAPVVVDDAIAAPLVDSGDLNAVDSGGAVADKPAQDHPAKAPHRARRSADKPDTEG